MTVVRLTPAEVVDRFGLKSVRTLENWRTERKGPPFCKFGARVLYPLVELIEWERAQTTETTMNDRNDQKVLHLTPEEVVERLRLSGAGTLANWRNKRKGPPFVKFGSRVLYPVDLLEQWEKKQLVETRG